LDVHEKLDLILEILGGHSEKLDEHSQKLGEQGRKLDEHSLKFDEQGKKLDEHSQKFDEQGRKLDEHSQKLDEQGRKLDEHSQKLGEHSELLGALIHGQQEIKADLDGFKLATFKRFDDLNKRLDSSESKQGELEAKVELLENRTWTNESDIHRLKNLIGMK